MDARAAISETDEFYLEYIALAEVWRELAVTAARHERMEAALSAFRARI